MRFWLGLVALLALTSCHASTDSEPALRPRRTSIESWQTERQLDYLRQSCALPLNGGSMNHALDHLTCTEQLPGFTVAAGAVSDTAWDPVFEKMWQLRDTSDFDMLRLMQLMLQWRGHPVASETLWQKAEDAVLNFKYWYSDPTPERTVAGERVVDKMWYWSENHQMIFRVCELLAGQLYPDRRFAVSGLTGRQHAARAVPDIRRWIDERGRWGFAEWHSNVYYNWDIQPMMVLAEWARDDELARGAAMVVDLLMLDIALHLHRGTYGATHGRSYAKDKPAAVLEDTFDAAKLFFDDTTLPYGGPSSSGGIFGRSQAYALPWIVREIARYDEPMQDRERMNLPLDEQPPTSAQAPYPAAPLDLSYDEAHLGLWWSMNAMTTWPLLPLTFQTADKYNLWEGQFKPLLKVKKILGDFETEAQLRDKIYPFYREFWPVITQPLLEQVNSYTYRTGNYMLSAAQSYRPGLRSNQTHIWQATLDHVALVFTQHPAAMPRDEYYRADGSYNWQEEEDNGGYWTGSASLPRVGAYRNAAIILYSPRYSPQPLGLTDYDYLDETHAYVPVAHMDAVTQSAGWTLARKADAYVALYSARPVQWRSATPELYRNGSLPFDLVASGGADNAWIVELGDAAQWGSFEQFAAAITAARVEASSQSDPQNPAQYPIWQVQYDSPSLGRMEFGWYSELTVAGSAADLGPYPRHDNPFVRSEFDRGDYALTYGDHYLTLDFGDLSRSFSPAPQ